MIVTDNSNDIYVGSTIRTLKERLQRHVSDYRTGVYKSSQEILKQGNYKIILIKNFPCNSKNELEREEGKFQRDLECINKNIAGRTVEEYRIENREALNAKYKEHYIENREAINARQKEYNMKNREALLAKKKEYYIENREAINAKMKEKFNCECGGKYIRINKSIHLKTKKHQKFKNTMNIK